MLRSRSPSEQIGEVGGCGDFRQAQVNLFLQHYDADFFFPLAAIYLFSVKQTLSDKGDMSFWETDRASAYKNLSIRVSDTSFDYIALYRPLPPRLYAMRPKTLLFGYSAAVFHYNTISRLFAEIAGRIPRNTTIVYLEDFGFPMKSILEDPSIRAVNSTARCLRVLLSGRKLRLIRKSDICGAWWKYLPCRMGGV